MFLIVYADTCGCVVSAYTHVYISCSAFRACIAVLLFHLYKPLSGIRAKDLRTTHGAATMILRMCVFEIHGLFVEARLIQTSWQYSANKKNTRLKQQLFGVMATHGHAWPRVAMHGF